MTHDIADLDMLHALYGAPGAAALDKVADRLTPLYRRRIAASRFCVLSTVGPEGTDSSPRGDDGPVVAELIRARCSYRIGGGTNGSTPCGTSFAIRACRSCSWFPARRTWCA